MSWWILSRQTPKQTDRLFRVERLLFNPASINRLLLPTSPEFPKIASARAELETLTCSYVESPELQFNSSQHNPYVSRAGELQNRVFSLLTRSNQTDETPFLHPP